MDHIKDLKIVITAGASGIGSEVAIALSKAGAKVMICDVNKNILKSFSNNNPEIYATMLTCPMNLMFILSLSI